MALICETVTADNMHDLRAGRDRSTADLVELRLDGVADVDVSGALEGRPRPVLVTCRPEREGGRFDGSEETRLRILGEAMTRGAEYVDIEWQANRRTLPAVDPSRLVLSHHDFAGVPDDVSERMRAMRTSNPAGLVKIACAAVSPGDLVQLRAVATADHARHIVIGMGTSGLITRACPGLFGSEWTYGGRAAPGQTSVDDLERLYRVRSQTASTRLFAITGTPLGHSASPAMHNAAFAALEIDAVYVAVEARDAGEFLRVADEFGIEGASVTAPLKSAWQALGVDVDDRAKAIGAANTLRKDAPGQWSATNFDVDGFLSPIRALGIPLKNSRCVVLGAGGAARAAVWSLVREGALVEVSARRQEQALSLAREFDVSAGAWPPVTGWDLLVNATPAGTWPDESAAPISRAFVQGATVYDLIYHPRNTQLLKWARESGAATIDGLEMLVAQAARQFEHWIGRSAPLEVMRAAAERFLEKAHSDEADNV